MGSSSHCFTFCSASALIRPRFLIVASRSAAAAVCMQWSVTLAYLRHQLWCRYAQTPLVRVVAERRSAGGSAGDDCTDHIVCPNVVDGPQEWLGIWLPGPALALRRWRPRNLYRRR